MKMTVERQTKFVTEWLHFNIDRQPAKCYVPFDKWLAHQIRMRTEKGQKAHKNYKCSYCGKKFTFNDKKTIDHVVPRSIGGLDVAINKVPACEPCNQWKDNLTLEQWLKHIQVLTKHSNKSHYDDGTLAKMIGNIKKIIKQKKKSRNKLSVYKF